MIAKAEAIVLRSMEYSNSSQILTVFTDNAGKLSLIAKGAHRKNNRNFQGGLQLLTHLAIVYYQKAPDQLAILKECELRQHFLQIRHNLKHIFVALYLAELVSLCLNDHEPQLPLFHTLREGLRQLATADCRTENLFLYLHWHILALQGITPQLDRCLYCRSAVDSMATNRILFFAPQHGGYACQTCKSKNNTQSFPFGVTAIKKLNLLLQAKNFLRTLRLSAQEYSQIYLLLSLSLHNLLNRELRLARYVANLPNLDFQRIDLAMRKMRP